MNKRIAFYVSFFVIAWCCCGGSYAQTANTINGNRGQAQTASDSSDKKNIINGESTIHYMSGSKSTTLIRSTPQLISNDSAGSKKPETAPKSIK